MYNWNSLHFLYAIFIKYVVVFCKYTYITTSKDGSKIEESIWKKKIVDLNK